MAVIPKDLYPGQTVASDPDYPHGKAQNVAVAGDGTGTPFEKAWLNDLWGFFQALLAAGGVTPSGTPDKVGASQYLTALDNLFNFAAAIALKAAGAAASVDNEILRADGTSGKTLQQSGMRISDAIEAEYISPKTRTVVLDPFFDGRPGKDPGAAAIAKWHQPNLLTEGGVLTCDTDSGPIQFGLSWLPDGATLTRVRAIVKPGAVRGGTGRMNLRVSKRTVAFGTPAAGSNSDIVSVFDDGLTTNVQLLDTLAFSEAVDKAGGKKLWITVVGGNTADASNDQLHALEVTFTDPGPKNV